jgi:dTDP-4-amino-4,6-dideoxygalactose transaminase
MSGNEITLRFEKEFADWIGRKFALTFPNGTESLRTAMWACGVGAGDEIIGPSLTYWASCAPALSLGAAVNFADVDPATLTIDPNDIEHRIGPRTKAIVVVHYGGHPCDMDPIVSLCKKHNIKLIEDVSHAHGGLYKGRILGTFGDVACMSMMTGKSFAIGEGGMLVTDDRDIWEHALAWGFYSRTGCCPWSKYRVTLKNTELAQYKGLPMGGYKHRLNQTCAAMGLVQLKYYNERMHSIQDAMNRFWDYLEGVPGIRAHRTPPDSHSTMGGWYNPLGHYRSDEVDNLPLAKFCEAVLVEGALCSPGADPPLHLHPLFHDADLFRQGRPTMIAFGQRDVRQGPGSLPVTEGVPQSVFRIPWFKHDRPEVISKFALAFRKVAENAHMLQ